MDLPTANALIGWATLALQVATCAVVIAYLFQKHSSSLRSLVGTIALYAFPLAFVLALIGSALTLYYSGVLGLEPCPLCWWQRIFLYPQVILFAIAFWKKDRAVGLYSIALSLIGLGIAAYQHILQVLPGSGLPCPATGTVSCAQRFLFELGYITYPLAAATLFAALIVLMFIASRRA